MNFQWIHEFRQFEFRSAWIWIFRQFRYSLILFSTFGSPYLQLPNWHCMTSQTTSRTNQHSGAKSAKPRTLAGLGPGARQLVKSSRYWPFTIRAVQPTWPAPTLSPPDRRRARANSRSFAPRPPVLMLGSWASPMKVRSSKALCSLRVR